MKDYQKDEMKIEQESVLFKQKPNIKVSTPGKLVCSNIGGVKIVDKKVHRKEKYLYNDRRRLYSGVPHTSSTNKKFGLLAGRVIDPG